MIFTGSRSFAVLRVQISKRRAPDDREEGEASDGADPSPPTVKGPLKNISNRLQNKSTEGARNKALEEGIEIGKQESADEIEEQDQQIKEQKERIKRLSEQLALEAAHLSLANQRRDLR